MVVKISKHGTRIHSPPLTPSRQRPRGGRPPNPLNPLRPSVLLD